MAEADAAEQYLGLIRMGDFLLDLRSRDRRAAFARAAAYLKFREEVAVQVFDFEHFALALSSVDDPHLWGPYESEDIFAAVTGRIDLEESAWQKAERVEGPGGVAAKEVARAYREKGASGLEGFSGNFTLLLWDRRENLVFVVSDLCGAQPVFEWKIGKEAAWGSHPDALAICVGESSNLDEDSLTEFLLTSMVTPPNTYYRRIRSLEPGTLVKARVKTEAAEVEAKTYFRLDFGWDGKASEKELAEELAEAFVGSIRRRTLPRLGRVAVALSGGLDSRTILAAATERSNMFAFCCFDEENYEFAIARAVAEALGVKLTPLNRGFEYYGENAEAGIRIAGGMGTFANNHFLGIAGALRELGTQNFLTGCYCDYLFKALPLNTKSDGLFGRQSLAEYAHEFYFTQYRMNLPVARAVRDRLEERFPEKLRHSTKPEDVFEVERRRTFPLFQEGDNEQRLVPQRVLHSYLPVADRQILEVYRKIPYQYKLDRSLFKKVVARICGPRLSNIPDANTGARPDASLAREWVGVTKLRLERKLRKLKPGIACESSWPDWAYYIPHSQKLKELWERPCAEAEAFLRKTLPAEDIRAKPGDYQGLDRFFFVQLLSLKIWMCHRC